MAKYADQLVTILEIFTTGAGAEDVFLFCFCLGSLRRCTEVFVIFYQTRRDIYYLQDLCQVCKNKWKSLNKNINNGAHLEWGQAGHWLGPGVLSAPVKSLVLNRDQNIRSKGLTESEERQIAGIGRVWRTRGWSAVSSRRGEGGGCVLPRRIFEGYKY